MTHSAARGRAGAALLTVAALLMAVAWACHGNLRFDDLTTCTQEGDCLLSSLHCDSGRCVACVSDAHCTTAGLPRCDPFLHRCVECGLSSDCPGGGVCKTGHCFPPCTAGCPATMPRCDDGACVECDEGTGCVASPAAPFCVKHVCGGCAADADCGGATPRCDPVSLACVQCQGNADCPAAAPLCDIAAGRCVATP